MKLLVEMSAVVHCPIDRVAPLVLTVHNGPTTGHNAWLFQALTAGAPLEGGPDRFSYRANGHGGTIEVDRTAFMITYQGGWWYRGGYQLIPHGPDTGIVHRVHNAARRARWSVPLANHFFMGFDRRTRSQFRTTIAAIGRELDCRTSAE